MLKFATALIIAAHIGEQQRVFRTAHRAEFQYEARPGYLYVRSRAISSRCNDNWDEFPAEEIEKSYRSFVGKPVFVNHVNHDHRRARGVIIDAALHRDRNPDGTPDTWAEVLMEVDAIRFPKLAKAILDREVDRTSMGCDVERSVCSACGNEARTPAEYCRHIPGMKGRRVYRRTASGQHVSELIRETCYGLGFFENSLLVEPPADPTAHFLGVDASGLGKAAARFPASEGQGQLFDAAPLHQPKAKPAKASADGWEEGEAQGWDHIGERHPHIYGDPEIHEGAQGDGEGIGWAASHLAHSRPDDPDADNNGSWDLTFHSEHVDPYNIDHKRHGGPSDGRVRYAAEGYSKNPDQVPPLVLVHRHGVYQVADGHHRAEGAKLANQKTVRAYVAYSPFPNEPSGDGDKAPYHGAEEHPGKQPDWEKNLHTQSAQRSPKTASKDASSIVVDASALLDDGSIRTTAYGEMKAPADVDTLREEKCPVCGDRETYDGEACQICGFVSPPAQFRDPDLDMAKNMDLRKQVVDPSLVDENGELQRVDGQNGIPGQEGLDGQQDPGLIDAEQLDENGLPASPYGDQALDGTQQGPGVSDMNGDGLIQPNEIDPEGNANVEEGMDPELGGQPGPRDLPYGAQDRTGQPFTPGPNMPDRPGEPEGPDQLLEDQQAEAPAMGQPGDGVSDLLCPSCGFSADATPPQTENMANPAAADDGIVAGDVCPNCQGAQLLTPAELQGDASMPPPAAAPIRQ